MDASGSPSVFISYARRDGRPIAERLLASLVQRGIGAWYDSRDLDPYQDYSAEIEDGIERSSHVAVCLTTASKDDESFVRREISYATFLNKRIVTLRFEEIPPHIQIATRTWIDFFRGWDAAFAELLARLRGPQIDEAAAPRPDPFRAHLDGLNEYVIGEIRHSVLNVGAILQLQTSGQADASPRMLPIAYQSRRPQWFDRPPEEPTVPEEPTFTSFQEAFEHHGRQAALLGEPGGGKTTTLLAFARDAVARRLANPGEPLPVFAPIRSWAGQGDLAEWLATVLQLEGAALRAEIDAGRALLLLDGLDELQGISYGTTGQDPRQAFLRALRGVGHTPLVVTSRAAEWRELAASTSGDQDLPPAVRLLPLRDDQIAAYLADDLDLLAALTADPTLRELARNPLLLTLLALAYRDEGDIAGQLRGLAESPGELRARVFTKYIERRYDFEQARSAPDAPLPFSLEQVHEFLGTAAMDLLDRFQRVEVEIREDGYSVTQSEGGVVDLVEVDIRALRRRFGPSALELIALAEQLQLLVPVRDGWVRFAHLLIRDHFAVPRAIAQLRAEDPDLRRRAAGTLGLVGDRRAVTPLLGALEDDDAAVRTLVLWALGEIRDPAAVGPIAEIVLKDEDGPLAGLSTSFGTAALGRIGGAEALAVLEQLLEQMLERASSTRQRGVLAALAQVGAPAIPALERALCDPAARGEASDSLGRIRDPRSTDALLRALEQGVPDWDVARALGVLGDPRAVPALARRLKSDWPGPALDALAAIGGTAATEVLLQAFHVPDAALRSQVALALGKSGGGAAVDALEGALDDVDLRVRCAAAEALEGLGYDRARLLARRPPTPDLVAALGDRDARIREEGARRLGARLEPGVADTLAVALGDADTAVRVAAQLSLADHGDERAARPLAERLFTDEVDLAGINVEVAAALGRVRSADSARYLLAGLGQEAWHGGDDIVKALVSIGAEAVDPLVSALAGADDELRVAIGSVLVKIGEPAIRAVAGLLGTPLRDLAVGVLGGIGDAATPAVIPRLQSDSAAERAAAATALGLIGTRAAVEPIATLLFDEEPAVGDAAAAALIELGEPSVDTLLGAIAEVRPEVRRRAAAALGEIGEIGAAPALDAALDDPDPGVRLRAARSVALLAEPGFRDSLRRRVDDPDILVRLGVRKTLAVDDGGPVEDALISALRRDDPAARLAAALALAERASFGPLVDALQDGNEGVRVAARAGLLAVDDESIDSLRSLFDHASPGSRVAMARVFASGGDVGAIRYLIETDDHDSLEEDDESVSILLGVPAQSGPILLDHVRDARTGPIAMELIRRMGANVVDPLIRLLVGDDELERAVAADLLVAIDRPSVRLLVEALQDGAGADAVLALVAVATTLGRISHPRAVAALEAVAFDADGLGDGDYPVNVRLAAVQALTRSTHPFARAALGRVARARSRKVRKAATEALRSPAPVVAPA